MTCTRARTRRRLRGAVAQNRRRRRRGGSRRGPGAPERLARDPRREVQPRDGLGAVRPGAATPSSTAGSAGSTRSPTRRGLCTRRSSATRVRDSIQMGARRARREAPRDREAQRREARGVRVPAAGRVRRRGRGRGGRGGGRGEGCRGGANSEGVPGRRADVRGAAFVADAHSRVAVYYAPAPPGSRARRRAVPARAGVRGRRALALEGGGGGAAGASSAAAPRVEMCRGGWDDARAFDDALVEERDVEEVPGGGGSGVPRERGGAGEAVHARGLAGRQGGRRGGGFDERRETVSSARRREFFATV